MPKGWKNNHLKNKRLEKKGPARDTAGHEFPAPHTDSRGPRDGDGDGVRADLADAIHRSATGERACREKGSAERSAEAKGCDGREEACRNAQTGGDAQPVGDACAHSIALADRRVRGSECRP